MQVHIVIVIISAFIAYISIRPFHIKKRIVDIYQYHNSISGILHIKHHPLCSYHMLTISIIYALQFIIQAIFFLLP